MSKFTENDHKWIRDWIDFNVTVNGSLLDSHEVKAVLRTKLQKMSDELERLKEENRNYLSRINDGASSLRKSAINPSAPLEFRMLEIADTLDDHRKLGFKELTQMSQEYGMYDFGVDLATNSESDYTCVFPNEEAESKQTEGHILHYLKLAGPPVSPKVLRKYLVSLGYREGAVRTAIARLWDQGYLNVDNERNLVFVKDKE